MAMGFVGRDMAVDLGTSTTQVYARGRGVVFSVPTSTSGPGPIRDGVIADVDGCVDLLESLVHEVHQRRYLARPRMLLAVPAVTTGVERRAVKEAAYQAGARQVFLVDSPLLVAIAAELPVHRPTGTMVVTLGAGLTEISVLSLGGVVTSTSAKVNGADMDRAIAAWLRAERGLIVGEQIAEDLKLELGTAWPMADAESLDITSRDISGMSRTVTVTGADLRHALTEPLTDIIDAITATLDATPGLADHIRDHGLVLAGGGALLPGIEMMLSRELDLPVLLAPDPAHAVIAGAGRCVDDAALLRSVLITDRNVA
ncbi:rod shape-determining protein [Nocardioides sp. Kera G14]|uniref:rod shape-determining protein n=1 Tax=Nocardioides sp. Kera G14 TaxID=2884264 RepID=UPI001D0F7280|nr:rod shape-determining protein [Nocardioides sp. Kera G14]UDY24492.1 rod shape-determining protein [Nocardioides sp. Kera G14]